MVAHFVSILNADIARHYEVQIDEPFASDYLSRLLTVFAIG